MSFDITEMLKWLCSGVLHPGAPADALFFALLCRVPTCLSLPEGLLQPVRPHKLTGLAHRQLFAAHPSRDEILFQI